MGPSANRVEGATVPIGGVVYRLPANEGSNNLHTDRVRGLHAQLWQSEVFESADCVRFTCTMGAGVPGSDLELPGARTFTVTYELDGTCLRVTFDAQTTAATFINLTNHSYFNLAGQASGSVADQELQLFAERFLPIDDASIPTGELRPVADTPFDFRTPKAIGRDIEAKDEQIARGSGYDHCFCIDGYEPDDGTGQLPELCLAARAVDPASGRGMELWTSLPGLQLYTGNFIGGVVGKGGHAYENRGGFALEPQFYPATPLASDLPGRHLHARAPLPSRHRVPLLHRLKRSNPSPKCRPVQQAQQKGTRMTTAATPLVDLLSERFGAPQGDLLSVTVPARSEIAGNHTDHEGR